MDKSFNAIIDCKIDFNVSENDFKIMIDDIITIYMDNTLDNCMIQSLIRRIRHQ